MKGMVLNTKVLPLSRLRTGFCDHECKRYTEQMFRISGHDSTVWTHKSCVCNEQIALVNRHQFDDGCTYTSSLDLKKTLRRHIRVSAPWSEQAVIEHAIPARKRLLQHAKDSLSVWDLEPNDGKVKMFLKDDKYHTPEYKAPRCIQYRNKRYGLRLATYLHPIEKLVMEWKHNGTHIFAKGRNMRQRGRDIAKKLKSGYVAISMDHSKFDSHVNEKLLSLEHWYYRQCCNDPELAKLLAWQVRNSGSTKNGTTYFTHATRMSGDQNTGLGNCIINYAMTVALLERINCPYELYIDGDDFIVFVPSKFASSVDPAWYGQFGMKTTLDQATTVLEHIDFCQCRPVYDGTGYTLVRNPDRLMSRAPWVVGPLMGTRPWSIIASAGQCEIALGLGLPIGQYLGQKMFNLGVANGGKFDSKLRSSVMASREKMKPGKLRVVDCAPGVRSSFELAWGIDIPTQLSIEAAALLPVDEEDWDEYPLVRYHH